MSNLSPEQFPHYDSDNYDSSDYVEHSTFGLPHEKNQHVIPGPGAPDRREVPLAHLVGTQGVVYKPHVENLATVPRHEFERIGAIPDVIERKDGRYNIDEGHHRVAAALVRGDEALLANVWRRNPWRD